MNRQYSLAIAGAVLAFACADGRPTAPVDATTGQAQVYAASTPPFTFLAPLGDASPPTGVFDAMAVPVLQLCSYAGPTWSEADCAIPLQQWTVDGKGPRKLAIIGESFEAEWKTKANQNQNLTYRIRVLLGAEELGFMDAGFDETQSSTGYYVLSRREALPIRFWIGVADEPEPDPDFSFTRTLNAPISDASGAFDAAGVQGSGCSLIEGVKVRMDIVHSSIADLVVSLSYQPAVAGAPTVTVILHNRTGGSTDLVGTYPDNLTPFQSLDALLGQASPDGRWTLQVLDQVAGNTGTLNAWGIDVMCGTP